VNKYNDLITNRT